MQGANQHLAIWSCAAHEAIRVRPVSIDMINPVEPLSRATEYVTNKMARGRSIHNISMK